MRVLEANEVAVVSGGWSEDEVLIGESFAVAHEGAAATFLVGAAFYGGIGLGLAWNAAFESAMGQSFGSWIYDATHSDMAKT